MKFGIFYEHQLPRPWEPGAELRIQVDGILGPQPIETIVRMLSKHRVERGELEVGRKRLFI